MRSLKKWKRGLRRDSKTRAKKLGQECGRGLCALEEGEPGRGELGELRAGGIGGGGRAQRALQTTRRTVAFPERRTH